MSTSDLPHVELYTDGACSGNPGPGGWAFVLKHPASGKSKESSGGERETTNNQKRTITGKAATTVDQKADAETKPASGSSC
jgi:hypothetical protein